MLAFMPGYPDYDLSCHFCYRHYRSSLGRVNETSSSTPVNTVTFSGCSASITFSTSTSGVEAPDVTPTLTLPSSQDGSISLGPLIRYAGTPSPSATSRSRLQLELFWAPITKTKSTTNRQEAVTKMAHMVELVLVIGAQNSSNCNRLREVAEALGVPAYLINGPEEINPSWLEGRQKVGVTSGASTPEVLVKSVVQALAPEKGIPVRTTTSATP